MKDFVIIGAGPTGSFLAKKLALNGFKVRVFEKEKRIGVPIQCTGLLTKKIKEYVNVNKEFLVNKTSKVILHSNNEELELKTEEFVVNRTKFDQYLKSEAEKCGVKYYTNHELNYYNVKNGKIELVFNNEVRVLTSNVIGCDGPLSKVNNLFKMNDNNKCFFAKQYVIKKENVENSTYHAYFNDEFKDFFSWSVPCGNNCVRIGTGDSNAIIVNKKLELFKNNYFKNCKILDVNAGLIPIHDPNRILFKKIKDSNIYLFGDAAGIVKATSGGGIIPSFQMINESFKNLINGESLVFPKTRIELLIHLVLHDLLNSLTSKELNDLLNDFSSEELKQVFKTTSRDSISKLVTQVLFKKPSLLKHAKLLLKLL